VFGRRRSAHAPLVVVGLGNPGPRYAHTRHIAGAELVERLAGELGVDLKRTRGQLRQATGRLADREVLLAVPTTYMNVSGPPVGKLVRKANAGPEDLVVCHDDIDLACGRVRMKLVGGTGGHRGLDSICASLRSKDFVRLRLGVGRPPSGVDATEHVLKPFLPEERDGIAAMIERGIEGLRAYVREGLDAAQNLLHAPN
jgi:peptidyl-tRNA hydrolase, PTH1 family